MLKKRKGFTLIEMVVVMLIISMLLLLIVPQLAQRKTDAQETANEAVVETIQSQVNMKDESKYKKEEILKWKTDLKELPGLNDNQKKKITELGLYLDKDGNVKRGKDTAKSSNTTP